VNVHQLQTTENRAHVMCRRVDGAVVEGVSNSHNEFGVLAKVLG